MTWAAVATLGGTIIGGLMSGKEKKQQAQQGSNSPAYYDPYAPYRSNAAQQLNSLMSDPSQVTSTPEYAAMLTAAGRSAASQGYNGSGNAIVAAAQAGGQAYQQAFNNLAMLSGAEQNPAQASALAAQQGNWNQQNQQNMWGGLGGIFGRLAGNIGNSWGSGGGGGEATGTWSGW